jgi:hypothetical protein
MPRRRKAARGYRLPRNIAAKLARLSAWELVGPAEGEYPAGFETAAERVAFDSAVARRNAAKAAQRDITLRERLATSPAESWGPIFCERPEWEETELTEEQRGSWQVWRAEAKRRKLRETQENLLAMPAVKSEVN